MAKYETMLITTATLDDEATAALVGKFKSLIEANGTIDSIDEWGKRRLAYPINDENEGIYTVINFTSEPDFPRRAGPCVQDHRGRHALPDRRKGRLIPQSTRSPRLMLNVVAIMGRLGGGPRASHHHQRHQYGPLPHCLLTATLPARASSARPISSTWLRGAARPILSASISRRAV